jgi:5-methylcytosine-specific restriction protein A
MPRKIPLPCNSPGCPGFRLPPERYCPAHAKGETALRFKQNLEKGRLDGRYESNKFYNTKAWRQTRLYVLNNEPTCRACGGPATMVDHINPIHEGGDATDLANLQPLCNSCHASKRGKEGVKAYKRRRGGQP